MYPLFVRNYAILNVYAFRGAGVEMIWSTSERFRWQRRCWLGRPFLPDLLDAVTDVVLVFLTFLLASLKHVGSTAKSEDS